MHVYTVEASGKVIVFVLTHNFELPTLIYKRNLAESLTINSSFKKHRSRYWNDTRSANHSRFKSLQYRIGKKSSMQEICSQEAHA